MSTIKPIKIYGTLRSPNPLKVLIVLLELNVPYESVLVENVKGYPFLDINPNGRVPAIEDPNTGIILWESGAIVQYLVDKYDVDHKISYVSEPEKYHQSQYLFFQMSGQGPYFGQGYWFSFAHPEKIPSAIDRYNKEIFRVVGVLDLALKGKEWLVGDKCTIADLSFVPWDHTIPKILGDQFKKIDEATYPNYTAWRKRLEARPGVQRGLEVKAEIEAAQQKH